METRHPGGGVSVSMESTIDPVCGMTVDPAKAAGQYDYKGRTYFFCGKGCLAKFQADPEKMSHSRRN